MTTYNQAQSEYLTTRRALEEAINAVRLGPLGDTYDKAHRKVHAASSRVTAAWEPLIAFERFSVVAIQSADKVCRQPASLWCLGRETCFPGSCAWCVADPSDTFAVAEVPPSTLTIFPAALLDAEDPEAALEAYVKRGREIHDAACVARIAAMSKRVEAFSRASFEATARSLGLDNARAWLDELAAKRVQAGPAVGAEDAKQ